MKALCPNCKASQGGPVSTELADEGGLVYSFECPECDHQWTVTV